MPRLSVWALRAAHVYLVTGFTLGLLLLINKSAPIHPAVWRLLPCHIEFLLFGWTLQLVMGIAYWILPRFGRERGDVRIAWAAVFLLNIGIISVVTGYWTGGRWSWIGAGRAVEAFAVVAFAIHAWPRIKSLGAQS